MDTPKCRAKGSAPNHFEVSQTWEIFMFATRNGTKHALLSVETNHTVGLCREMQYGKEKKSMMMRIDRYGR